jgi:hypothetical protein
MFKICFPFKSSLGFYLKIFCLKKDYAKWWALNLSGKNVQPTFKKVIFQM